MHLSENTKAEMILAKRRRKKSDKLFSSIHLATFGIQTAVALHKLLLLCFQCFIGSVFIYLV